MNALLDIFSPDLARCQNPLTPAEGSGQPTADISFKLLLAQTALIGGIANNKMNLSFPLQDRLSCGDGNQISPSIRCSVPDAPETLLSPPAYAAANKAGGEIAAMGGNGDAVLSGLTETILLVVADSVIDLGLPAEDTVSALRDIGNAPSTITDKLTQMPAMIVPPEDEPCWDTKGMPRTYITARVNVSQADSEKLATLMRETLLSNDAVKVIPACLQPDSGPQILAPNKSALPETENLERLLTERFPTLRISGIGAEVKLELTDFPSDPVMTEHRAAIQEVTGCKPAELLAKSPPALLKETPLESRTVPELLPKTPAVTATVTEPIVNGKSLTRSQKRHHRQTNPAQVVRMPLGSERIASTSIVSNVKDTTDAPSGTGAKIASEVDRVLTKADSWNLATAVTEKSSESIQAFSSPVDSARDRCEAARIERPPEQQSQIPESKRFKLEFNRFQINALLKRSEMRIQLHPSSLGSMRIKLVSTPHELTARFETTSEAARSVVEQNLPQLRESLEKAGVKVDQMEVVVDEQRSRQQQAQYESQRKYRPAPKLAEPSMTEKRSSVISTLGGIGASSIGGLNLLA